MTTINLNSRSSRAQKARLAKHLGHWSAPVFWAIIATLVAAWLFTIREGQSIGWSALGLAIWVLMFQLWSLWDLRRMPPVAGQGVTPTTPLDEVLEQNLLASLPWPATAPQAWQAAVQRWEGVFVVVRLGLPSDIIVQILQQSPDYDPWPAVVELAANQNAPEIDGGIVVAAILTSAPKLDTALTELKLDSSDVYAVVEWQQRIKQAMNALHQKSSFGGIGRDWASGYTPTLNRFANNLSREIEYGYYQHLQQLHQPVVDQLVEQLAGGKASVAVIGEVGSGKTATVYALAERLIKGEKVKGLEYYYVLQLNASLIISAGGQIEQVVLQLLNEAMHAKNIIIFLDEAQLFFGRGTGAVDLSQVLLPILQQSPLKIVMAMTPQDWQNLTAVNPGLGGIIQRLTLPKPAEADVMRIMADAAVGIEQKNSSTTSYAAIKEAYQLADRYVTESAFPGKGINLLDSAAHYSEQGYITAASVQRAVEATIGTKVVAAGGVERAQLLNLEDQIHERMINQSRAVRVVSDALRRARAGVRNQSRPVGSFLFLGPTGVGKTELAKALADIYFGGEDQIIRVDMSEYQQPGDISRLLAASTGGRSGTTLIASVRKQPFSVVLFDEIEKAHPDVLNLLLQLLDEGRLTDTDGRTASFKDAIVISTSNASADQIREKIEAGQKLEAFEDEIVNGLIESHQFRPELLNRFDEIVLFRPLDKKELNQIVGLMIKGVNKTLAQQKIEVVLTPAAIDWLVERGYDPHLGARPMRRMVQRAVENTVAQRILAGTAQPGSRLQLDVADLHTAD